MLVNSIKIIINNTYHHRCEDVILVLPLHLEIVQVMHMLYNNQPPYFENGTVYLKIKTTAWILDAPGLSDKQEWCIRRRPSKSSKNLRTVCNGAIVEAIGIKDGWLELANGCSFL